MRGKGDGLTLMEEGRAFEGGRVVLEAIDWASAGTGTGSLLFKAESGRAWEVERGGRSCAGCGGAAMGDARPMLPLCPVSLSPKIASRLDAVPAPPPSPNARAVGRGVSSFEIHPRSSTNMLGGDAGRVSYDRRPVVGGPSIANRIGGGDGIARRSVFLGAVEKLSSAQPVSKYARIRPTLESSQNCSATLVELSDPQSRTTTC